MEPSEKSELLDKMMDWAVADESEERIYDVLTAGLPYPEDVRLILYDAHYLDQGERAPQSNAGGGEIRDWIDSSIDDNWYGTDHYEDICLLVGGDSDEQFMSYALKGVPEAERRYKNHPLYKKHKDKTSFVKAIAENIPESGTGS